MPRTAFDPAVHGFLFPNRFVNVVAPLPNGARLRTRGRCGGMTYAALDYFHRRRAAPRVTATELPRGVPPDGDPLADYLLERQLESFANESALRFLVWTLWPDDPVPFAGGVRKWTAAEIPKLRAAIDLGEPVPLGLIGARSLDQVGRRNHQVVAFGYEVVPGGVDILVYDPNSPGTTTTLRWRKGHTDIAASNRVLPWRGLFVHSYEPKRPPAAAG